MKKKLFSLISVLSVAVALAFSANAQNVKVSGVISDANGPIAGAVVMVQGTTNGTATDIDGKYTISADANAVLEISCLGYTTVNEAVSGRASIDVTLTEDTMTLADAVVLGYGVTTKKKDLSAAVGVVADPEKLATKPVTSTEAMLQGQLPGVTISANGGDPTSTPTVVIRGQGSQNGDSVLWVVDGIPGAPINSLDDIESIVVLKDAASAAIYGAQSGAGGVILVTTKKGKEGVSVSYDGQFGVRQATNVIESLNAEQERAMRVQSYKNAGEDVPTGWDLTKNPYAGTTRTDWVDEIFRNAFYQRHNVVVNAGTEKFKNRVSFNYDNSDGVLVGTYKKSLGVNYRGSFQINKWVKISEDLNWSQIDQRTGNTSSAESGAIVSAIYMPQSAAKERFGGGYGGTTTEDPAYIAKYGSNFADIHGDVINPLRTLTANTQFYRKNKFFSTTGLELANFVEGLKFNSRFSAYVNNSFYKDFKPSRPEIGKPDTSNELNYEVYRDYGWKTENTLTYDKTFGGKHTVGALLSTTADFYQGRGLNVGAKNFSDESAYMQYLAFAGSISQPEDYMTGNDSNVSIIARGAYSYDDRYFVTASWRRDYAGRLPQSSNHGDFPAVTGAWKITSEPFFPKMESVNLLKIRASWGRIGNLGSVPMNYKSNSLSSKNWSGESGQYGMETGAGEWGTFYYNGTALNPYLTWETSEQTDLGLDLAFCKERLNIGFDFYNKRTYNLIQEQASGWTTSIGVDPKLVNLGEVMNRGVELSIGWSDKIGNWSYFVNANGAYNKNWVSNIGVTDNSGNKGVWTGDGHWKGIPYIYQTAEGQPLNSYYLVKCLGIFQSDAEAAAYVDKDGNRIQPNAVAGDLKFQDFNGDGVIDNNDRQYMGNASPKFTYAANIGFSYKNLSVSAMFQGVAGAQAANVAKYMIVNDSEGNFNRSTDILNAWTPTNTNTDIPRLCKTDKNGNFSTASSFYLEDASYLRLKNLTVSYDFTSLLRKVPHFMERNSSCMVYFSGENLFTATKYSGMDPECGGYDTMKYPVSRVLSLGVKITY